MLILGRRVGESIVIDGGITVTVLACERGGVRLGIQAPSEITILRGEIVRQVEESNRRAPADPAAARAWMARLAPGAEPDAPNGATGAQQDAA